MEKLVIYGWNNITASLAEGIRRLYPACIILCPDAPDFIQSQYRKERILSPLSDGLQAILENADYILLGSRSSENLEILKSIRRFIDSKTLIMDFQAIKADFFEKASYLLKNKCFFASVFTFIDLMDSEAIRSDLFQDKIVAVVSDGNSEVLEKIRDFWQHFKAVIVPTSAEFYDEIFSATTQGIFLLTNLYMRILQRDSWADTLFFGFYNRSLRNFAELPIQNVQNQAIDIIANKENILRVLSFMKREIEQMSSMINDGNARQLAEYIEAVQKFQDRL
ncbi:Prephenate dehydrogenase [Brevinema andersonii]|uniref:Prephenate dehydrogenase n=1 Tax=Brevinema andersonii TaxID=34097 RepID=A0A1I1EMD7_BREAD|nr:prephenate dehydrogenase/arogenate dehydrogenase family protein [Brevinema andersonii]SFB86073.1 Prephenate dehydrogenase [Brevinema andersonii]